MTRRLKTILLLLAPSVLYAAGLVYRYQPETVVFLAILVGIISYGYLVMADEEFDGGNSRLLLPFAFACAGCTSIAKVFIDALLSHVFPMASIAAAGGWTVVVAFIAIRTPLVLEQAESLSANWVAGR
jgi:hypothetical protein